MKRPGLVIAMAVLVVSNAFVLIHVRSNRSGPPDSEIELTAREVRFYGSGREDSSVTLMLTWQNPSAEYRYSPEPVQDAPVWFDAAKLKEAGFDLPVPAEAKDAERHYRNARSREVFVALEYDGPAWQEWLKRPGPLSYVTPTLSADRQMEIRRETDSRLVAMDVASSADALREKYPDRKRVIVLRGLARVVRDDIPRVRLRGAITKLATDSINVPQPLSREFDGQGNYMPWTQNGGDIRIQPLPYSVTLAIGSHFEPWVKGVKRLR